MIFKSKSGGDVFASKGRKGRSRDVHSGSVENPVPQPATINDDTWSTKTPGDRLVIVMVGLPARGKTYIGRRLKQYLRFFHDCRTEIFNVGNYRRRVFGVMRRTHFLIQMIRKHQRNASSAQRWQCPT